MSNNKSVIVKKIKKHGGGGHHGGSWKVAYADFVTAMMAFFLLLWLLNMTSDEKRIRLSQYFKHFSIYTEGGTSFMGKTSEMFSESGETQKKVFSSRYGDEESNVQGGGRVILQVAEDEVKKIIGEGLKKDVKEKLGDVADQVLIDVVDGGVRIQMVDKDGSSMFELGSNRLTPKAKKVFKVIGDNINGLRNKVAIEGHTDALPYARNDYSNWELSTERASTARRELEANGLAPDRISRVSGFASTDPLIREDPSDPRNRRISIILRVTKEDVEKFASGHDEDNDVSEGRKAQEFFSNLPRKEDNVKTASDTPAVFPDTETPSAKNRWNPVMNEDTREPVINSKLSPILNENDSKPVINDDWGLKINRDNADQSEGNNDSPEPKERAKSPQKKKNLYKYTGLHEQSATGGDRDNKSADEKTITIEIGKDDVQIEVDKNENSSKMIDELSEPIISPFLKKDIFNK